MKRFKLSRKEKLLYATPLLLPLLVLAWPLVRPLVSADSLDRTLRELAGPQAVDCGVTSISVEKNPCAIAAFKAGQPFKLRYEPALLKNQPFYTITFGFVKTPTGQFYSVEYSRGRLGKKAFLTQTLWPKVTIDTENGQQIIRRYRGSKVVSQTRVWR